MMRSLAALFFLAASAFAGDGGFLFATFKGEQTPMSEQIYFGLSKDGRKWDALNGGEPVLVSKIGERGVRDPYLIRSHDKRGFILIATDLSIHHIKHDWKRAVTKGSRSIVVWTSRDLVEWSEPRLLEVAPEDAGCTWAPEIVYDEEAGDYLIFWASTTKRDKFEKHRIWAVRTKNFRDVGEPFVFIEKPTTIIDTTIIHDGSKYFRFTKDEKFKSITLESSEKLMGDWREIPEFSLSRLTGFEGPECFQIEPATDGKPATWCLVIDNYAKGAGYKPFITTDLAGGHFEPAGDVTFPFRFRHGSILPLTKEEYERVEQAYDNRRVEVGGTASAR